MERRGLIGLVIGVLVLAAVAGIAAWRADSAEAAVVLAFAASVAAVWLGVLLWRTHVALQALTGEVAELQAAVQDEATRRNDVEQQLANRIQLTAVRRATQNDALTDPDTGLFSEGYFTVALDARIAAARRNLKPVAVVVLEAIEGLHGAAPHPIEPSVVASTIRDTIRESDTACRLLDGGFALVLEDTSETGAIWTVERLRRSMVDLQPDLTLWAGIACYPAHGFTSEEILDRVDLALDAAREWRQDRIEVATADG